jgi:hypothetical protein
MMIAISLRTRRYASYPRKSTMVKFRQGVSLLEPAVYQIRIQGILDKNWSEYYGGMTIEHEGDPKQSAMTILMGKLADQSALIGVLNSLHDIGYSILSVEYLEAG